MFKNYINYFKDNPKNYWFKAKLYGWGWTPVKWQGWVIVGIFICFISWVGINFGSKTEITNTDLIWFFIKMFLSVGLIFLICYKTGEKPRWQWGPPKNKNK